MEAFPRPRPFEQPRPSLLSRIGFGNLDPLLLVAGIGLIAFSIYTLGVATQEDVPGDPYYYAVRQSIYAVIGIALMLAVARVDYSRFRELRVGIYTAMIASICLVFVFAQATRGTRAWIELPFFTFQPSELGKVLLIVSLAAFALDTARRSSEARRTIRLLALGFFPAGLVLLQPDLGTALVYGAVTLAIMFLAGVRWTHFAIMGATAAGLAVVALVIAPAVGVPVLKDYQEDRLTAFLHPSDDPADSSYQINQSLIAVGSGGKTGRGDDATQTSKRLLAGAPHRLHLCGRGRALRLRRSRFPTLSIRPAHLEGAAHIDPFEELFRQPDRRRDRRDADVPCARQRGHEHRSDADHRHPIAADELGRVVRDRHLPGARTPAEHLRSSAAHLQAGHSTQRLR